MKIFAIDTSGKIASAAISDDGKLIDSIEKNTNLRHSEAVLPVCTELLERNGLTLGDIDAFAVVTGPGSFTGLRIGIAAAKGFALMLEKPLIGVTALECCAYAEGRDGVICPLIRARQNDYFYGLYRCENGEITQIGENGSDDLEKIKEKTGSDVVYSEKAFGAAEAAVLAYRHMKKGEITDAHSVNPVYLKLSQAERMKLEQNRTESSENK